MSKINSVKIKYSITCGLAILAILALGVIILPSKAGAQSSTQYDTYDDGYAHLATIVNPSPYIRSVSPKNNDEANPHTLVIAGNGFIPSSVARVDGANRKTTFIDNNNLLVTLEGNEMTGTGKFFVSVFNGAPGGGYSNARSFNRKNIESPAQNNNSYNTGNNNNNENNNSNNENYGNSSEVDKGTYLALLSNTIFGSGGLLPSGLIQWVLLAIFIVLLIIFVRKSYGASEKYHGSPMKHA